MTTERILETVTNAARSRLTISVLLKTSVGDRQFEAEPYSVARHHREQTFFYWDLEQQKVVGVPVTALAEVTPTEREFTPRYEVEF